MNSRQQLLSLLAASSLAALFHGCGGNNTSEPAEPEGHTESGGEAEAACGGGACGAATSQEQES